MSLWPNIYIDCFVNLLLMQPMSLFRPEVFAYRKDKLHGDVHMALPVSWQVIGGLVFLIVVVAIIFLTFASYSRIETVTGQLNPSSGVAQIIVRRPGTIEVVSVKEGQEVKKGQILASISVDETLADGRTNSAELLSTLELQEAGLRKQEGAISAASGAGGAQYQARIDGYKADVLGLLEQIAVQEGLVTSAKDQLDQALVVAERGFISKRDILVREETYLARIQQLSQLNQTFALRRSSILETQRAAQQASAQAKTQIAALSAQKSDIAQRRTNIQINKAYQLIAPISGRVTAITARNGQFANIQTPLMMIVPTNAKLQAELSVPTTAIGFLEKGQQVKLSIDAFPYQKFGTLNARLSDIAKAPITQLDATGASISLYQVIADIEAHSILAFGKEHPLIAGMTLSARVETEKQSILEWLFEPLFAVQKR